MQRGLIDDYNCGGKELDLDIQFWRLSEVYPIAYLRIIDQDDLSTTTPSQEPTVGPDTAGQGRKDRRDYTEVLLLPM